MPQRPEDVQVFCGLPLTYAEFSADATRGPADRFVPMHIEDAVGLSFSKGWTQQHIEGAWRLLSDRRKGDFALLSATLEWVSGLGTDVIDRATAADFAGTAKRAVVVLISHCSEQRVEFRDGMLAAERLGDGFAEREAREQTIDLTLCNGIVPHDVLRRRLGHAPRILIGIGAVPLGLKLAAFRLALTLLGKGELDYIEAYSAAWKTIKQKVYE